MADWHLWLPPALAKPRFRLYAAGHTVAVIGAWIQQVAISWLVFRLSGSVLLLGITGFLLNIFYLLLGPVGGLAADYFPRVKFLIAIDLFLAACAALLALMTAAGVTSIPAYLLIATLIGAANAFEMPVRQTLMRDIVEERALVTSALGRERHGVQRRPPDRAGHCRAGARLSLGSLVLPAQRAELCRHHRRLARHAPAVASTTPQRHGRRSAGLCRLARRHPRVSRRALSAADGGRHRPLRHALRAADAVDRRRLLRWPLLHPRPAHELGGGGRACRGRSLQPGYGRQLRLQTAAPLAVGIALALFAWSRMLPVSALLLAVMGGAAMLGVNATNAMLQQSVPDEWRGRVVGIYSMSFAGTAPIGGLLSGWLAERIGLAPTLTLNGLIIVAVGLLGRWRLHTHPEALRGIMRGLSR